MTIIAQSPATEDLALGLQCDRNYALAIVCRLAGWLHDERRSPRFDDRVDFTVVLGVPASYTGPLLCEHLHQSGWARRCVSRDGRVYFEMRGWDALFPEDKRREQERMASQRWRDKRSAKKRAVLPAALPTMREPTAAESIAFLEKRGYVVGQGDRFDD